MIDLDFLEPTLARRFLRWIRGERQRRVLIVLAVVASVASVQTARLASIAGTVRTLEERSSTMRERASVLEARVRALELLQAEIKAGLQRKRQIVERTAEVAQIGNALPAPVGLTELEGTPRGWTISGNGNTIATLARSIRNLYRSAPSHVDETLEVRRDGHASFAFVIALGARSKVEPR